MPKSQLCTHGVAMKLRIGQVVHSTDGVFGELADIVVDPTSATVTHIVVEPSKQHQQARLVPIWLVDVVNEIVQIALGGSYIRQLQRVGFDDFVRPSEKIDIGDQWDVGSEDLIARPYWDIDELVDGENEALAGSKRVAKAECEIRRHSEVTTSDFHLVGHVAGFIASESHLMGCVVQIGLPGLRHHKVVPMDAVAEVYDREIILSLTEHEFAALPRSPGLDSTDISALDLIDARTRRVADVLRDSASRLAARTRHRYQRAPADSNHDRVDS